MSKYKQYPLALRLLRNIYPLLEFSGIAYKKIAQKLFFYPIKYPFPSSEKPFIESAKIQAYSFENQEINLYQWGNQNANKKLLLVHGWAGRATQFRSIIQHLEEEYLIYSFDAPGHGLSKGDTSNMLEMARIAEQLINKYTIDCLIGHSLGGAACIYTAANYKIPIDKLILIGTPSTARNMLADFTKKLNGGEKTKQFIHNFTKSHFGMELNEFFAEFYLPKENIPETLIFHDEDDFEVQFDNFEQFKTLLPQAKFETTQNLGHTKILRDEEVIKKIADFIR